MLPVVSGRIQTYHSAEIAVTFDPSKCGHTGVCLRGLPAVFDTHRPRWIRVDAASADEVAAQVAQCPTGALQATRQGREQALIVSLGLTPHPEGGYFRELYRS